MNLFIDTNIFLAFYHYTSDDLEELGKLNSLIAREILQLFLPQQVEEEFQRNRENKIADALKRLKEQRLSLQFPQLCKDYPSYMRLRELQKEYEQAHSELLVKLDQDITSENLKADQIIKELFHSATKIARTNVIIDRARRRVEVGNPPGKSGSLGDAVNWESLLEDTPLQQPLYFLTDDKDYCSPLDENRFDPFLLSEWESKKNSQLLYYNKVAGFLKEKYPEIILVSEYDKENVIRELANSQSFLQTHNIIAKLRKHGDFTLAQVNDIISACISNTQVYWIIGDSDVREFLEGIIQGKEETLEPNNLRQMKEYIAAYDQERSSAAPANVVHIATNDDDLPF